jgi:chromosome segregation ATPase
LASQARLTKELQEAKTQLAQASKAPPPPADPTPEVQTLLARQAQLTQEFEEVKAQLTSQLQETQHKLDGFHPELQSLQDELRNGELQIQLLDVELIKKEEEIKDLENRLRAYTSLAPSSSPV